MPRFEQTLPNKVQRIALKLSDKLDKLWTSFFGLFAKAHRIQIGDQTVIRRGAILSTKFGGSIHLGESCEIHPTAMILTYGGDIKMGAKCSLNPGSIIYGHGGVTIGNGVRIAAHAVIIPANHETKGPASSIHTEPVIALGISIGNNVWIGAHAVILDGVHLADGCVIAAGAVVVCSTEPNGIYGGVPARLIKYRNQSSQNKSA